MRPYQTLPSAYADTCVCVCVCRSDEPTNHLDAAAIRWLGQFLRASGGTLVIVSHDEQLLEDVCDHIAEVSCPVCVCVCVCVFSGW